MSVHRLFHTFFQQHYAIIRTTELPKHTHARAHTHEISAAKKLKVLQNELCASACMGSRTC
jgi:hypothetical protein